MKIKLTFEEPFKASFISPPTRYVGKSLINYEVKHQFLTLIVKLFTILVTVLCAYKLVSNK